MKEPLNSVASFYLTSWYGSTLDESCVSNSDEAHRCWDASYLYNYVDSSMFLVQNQFDQLQVGVKTLRKIVPIYEQGIFFIL